MPDLQSVKEQLIQKYLLSKEGRALLLRSLAHPLQIKIDWLTLPSQTQGGDIASWGRRAAGSCGKKEELADFFDRIVKAADPDEQSQEELGQIRALLAELEIAKQKACEYLKAIPQP